MTPRDREPESCDLATFALRCFLCAHTCSLSLPAAERLSNVVCPRCGRAGGMQTAPAARRMLGPPPSRPNKFDNGPDLEGDEYLLERRGIKCD